MAEDDKALSMCNFEAALKDLEVLVTKLEKGGLGLEASLKYFEEGVALANACQKVLKDSEQKVAMLVGNDLKAFDPEQG